MTDSRAIRPFKKRRKNPGLSRLLTASVEGFTSQKGLRLRRRLAPLLTGVMRRFGGVQIEVVSPPRLQKGQPYIFASTHSFADDILVALCAIPRNAYLLLGSTQTLLYHPDAYALWLNGVAYVDVLSKQSRQTALPKLERVLSSGNSVLIFPEACWNTSENLLVNYLYPGVHDLAMRSGAQVVPLASYSVYGSKKASVSFGEPMTLPSDRSEALQTLRDILASLRLGLMERHPPGARAELPNAPRRTWLQERREEALNLMDWQYDAWQEEYNAYRNPHLTPEKVWGFLEDIPLTSHNARHLASHLAALRHEKSYDFVPYLQRTWNKPEG